MKVSRPYLYDWLLSFQDATGLVLEPDTENALVDYMLTEIIKAKPKTELVGGIRVYDAVQTPEMLLSQYLNEREAELEPEEPVAAEEPVRMAVVSLMASNVYTIPLA